MKQIDKLENDYYSLKQLIPIVNLSYTQLKRRIKSIKEKFQEEKLIFKKSNRYFIHKSIIDEFKRNRNPIDYKLFISISPEGYYDTKFLRKFVNDIYTSVNEDSPLERFRWVWETKSSGRIHIHILTTYNYQFRIRKLINNHPLGITKLNIHFKKIKDDIHLKNELIYIRKENKSELLKPLNMKRLVSERLFSTNLFIN